MTDKTTENAYDDLSSRDIEKLKRLQPVPVAHDSRQAEAVEYNCLQHLARLGDTLRKYNEIHKTKLSLNDVKLYEPAYSVKIGTEGSEVAYCTSDQRVLDAAAASTKERFFNNLIASGPRMNEAPRIPTTEVGKSYKHFSESLRNADGDAIAARNLTADAMKDSRAYRPNPNKDWSGQTKLAKEEPMSPNSPTQFPAYASSMVLKFSDRTAFDLWFAANSSVKMLSNPSVNMDDGSITVEVTSDYVNSSGTQGTDQIRGGVRSPSTRVR
ncbi:MAG: hypothetical protein ABSF63_12880 [Candidatus Bathyarchaeia archaeon]|jgi:hypothetical protein